MVLESLKIRLGSCRKREAFFGVGFGKRGRPGNGIVVYSKFGDLVRKLLGKCKEVFLIANWRKGGNPAGKWKCKQFLRPHSDKTFWLLTSRTPQNLFDQEIENKVCDSASSRNSDLCCGTPKVVNQY